MYSAQYSQDWLMVEHPYAFPYTSDETSVSTQLHSAQVLLQQPAHHPLSPRAQWEHHYGGVPPDTQLPMKQPLGIHNDHAQAPSRDLCNEPLLPGHQPSPPGHYEPPLRNYPGMCYIGPQVYKTEAHLGNKMKRARVSCDCCRKRKTRCSEGQPCAMCKVGNLECTYTDHAKARKDAHSVSDMLIEVQSHVAAIEKRLPVLEKYAAGQNVDLLFQPYMMHIHRLYPFLDVESLKSYLKEFHRKFLADLRTPSALLSDPGGPSEQQTKRRKCPEDGDMELSPGDCLNSHVTSQNSCARERTLVNAIVYLILALGQICGLGEPVADSVREVVATNKLDPLRQLGISLSTEPPPLFSGQLSSDAGYSSTARSPDGTHVETLGGNEAQAPINMPGGAYYLQACAILGDFSDSNELAYAQACILASLYKGQLGRTEESRSWIHIAARICLYRVKVDCLSDAIRKTGVRTLQLSKNEHLIVLAYWTTFQLERNILTVCDYDPSGLTSSEPSICVPTNLGSTDG